MKGQFHDNQAELVRNSVDIVDVVSEYVPLKPNGQNHWGCCPFHSEKTPSFSVHAQKQIFHCFGCKAGGDVFDFLMRYHNTSFPEALKMLAARAGIQLAQDKPDPEAKRLASEREDILAINRVAVEFFQSTLRHPGTGARAQKYLADRGLPPGILREFAIGYAPDSWDALGAFLAKKGVTKERAFAAGLLTQKDGRFYDRFRGRVMLPIADIQHRIVGFGGRVLVNDDKNQAKYLNSSQTLLYDKKQVLYGINLARDPARAGGSVFVVEGYFDMITLYAQGVKNTVATCGTALTQGHVRLLKSFAREAVLVFDGDSAGIAAARRSLPVFLGEKMSVRVLVPPGGHDPDTFVREHGGAAFLELAKTQSQELLPFLMDASFAEHGQGIEATIRVMDDMVRRLSVIEDSFTRSLYARAIAERLGVDQADVLAKLVPAGKTARTRPAADRDRSAPRANNRGRVPAAMEEGSGAFRQDDAPWPEEDVQDTSGAPEPFHSPRTDRDALKLEREIVTVLVVSPFPEYILRMRQGNYAARFKDPLLQTITERALARLETEDPTPPQGLAQTPEEEELLASLAGNTAALTLADGNVDRDCALGNLDKFEHCLEKSAPRLYGEIGDAEKAGDEARTKALMMALLQKQKAAVKTRWRAQDQATGPPSSSPARDAPAEPDADDVPF